MDSETDEAAAQGTGSALLGSALGSTDGSTDGSADGGPGAGRLTAAGRPWKIAQPVRYSVRLGADICERMAAGEALEAICRGPGMPASDTVHRWVREQPEGFGAEYHRAKALAQRNGLGPNTTYTEMTAAEICVRVAEGESLSSICRDPAMPTLGTLLYWQRKSPDFAEALALAREARAERFTDVGWDLAMAATTETAYLTHVRLAHLRWNLGIMSPKSHGRMKPAEPPETPKVTHFLFKHFRLEEHPQTGLVRMVTYLPDPDTGQPRRVAEGPWSKKPGGLRGTPDVAQLEGAEAEGAEGADADGAGAEGPSPGETLAQAQARAAARHPPRDREGWL